MNVNLLKAAVVARGKKQQDLAVILSVNRSTLSRKLKRPEELISVGEMAKIIESLSLSPSETSQIFFSQ